MNIIDICQVKYPGEIEKGYISFRKPENDILLDKWEVLNIQRPTEEELLFWQNDGEVILKNIQNKVESELRLLIEAKPRERGYDNIFTLCSYVTSSNSQWQAEANAFISWRDSVFIYAYDILVQVQSQQISAPTIEEFMLGLPLLEWP